MTYTNTKQSGANQYNEDPVAVFLADPDSHLADALYINFRLYKKRILYDFFRKSLRELAPGPSSTLCIADVGASMGFDIAYILRRLTNCFKKNSPWLHTKALFIEGDPDLITKGQNFWENMIKDDSIEFKYLQPSFNPLPLKDRECDIIICSEVVEHLETPQVLLKEIYRALKPGGFLLFTTDNSPNFLHMIRRVPIWLQGKYHKKYARPKKEDLIEKFYIINKQEVPIYGHINLRNTQSWERQLRKVGFQIYSFGTYESIRRGGGSRTPLAIASYFMLAFLVSLLPRRIGRFFGDTTALLLRKPA